MVMTSDNRFVGAVSGGCVETDVYEAACDVLAGDGPLLLHYKHVENPLVEIGLSCDGQIDVLVERSDETPRGFDQRRKMSGELEQRLGRSVDLVYLSGLVNPYMRREILSTARTLYAA